MHVWKTAGESIVEALRWSCDVQFRSRTIQRALRRSPKGLAVALGWQAILIRNQHLKASDIIEIMPPGLFEECYSFGFVRNPWDRLVSGYRYAKQTRHHPEHYIVRDMTNISDYISYREKNYPISQSDLLFDSSGRQLVTKVGRFETLTQDFDIICNDIGLSARLDRTNASQRVADWKEYFTERDYQRVADIYRRDIEVFGY